MSTPTRPEQPARGYSASSANPLRSTSPSAGSPSVGDNTRPGPFSLSGSLNSAGKMAGGTRSGNGSPSHDMAGSSRLFSKRAREIQAQEGIPSMPLNLWGGPPTSGNSTPLRENIPESPTDGFPGFSHLPALESVTQPRRARAGTLPSRFSPGGINIASGGSPHVATNFTRGSPSQSPYNQSPSPNLEAQDSQLAGNGSLLLSRLRAGSMPQRSQFAPQPGNTSPFGHSIFSNWNPVGVGRERGSTLASIASVGSNGPSSPAQSQFSKEGNGDSDVHMRTLDYLGLAETPQQPKAQLVTPYLPSIDYARQANRFRSYSVNNKDKYADEEDGYDADGHPIDSSYAAIQDQLAATQAAIHNHNLAVQAFVNQTNVTRPRARTAGVLDTPGSRLTRTYFSGASNGPNMTPSAEARLQEDKDNDDLSQAIASMGLGRSNSHKAGLLGPDEQGLEGPTSALWLGSIPTSTTTSTLLEMFKPHGQILSARVLTHKNCGFVNFERVESAISAKASMNGKEIFPGAGPIRINFAKPPSASNTPGHEGLFPSPSPDPYGKAQEGVQAPSGSSTGDAAPTQPSGTSTPAAPLLRDMTSEMLGIVSQFGATQEDQMVISRSLQCSIEFNSFVDEIPPVREPTHTRIHDAPKLRDIRKRIDNQTLSQNEIESLAIDMLPEISELSSDYLGNTVVQKLFEHCSDQVRDAMLAEIAPHIAEIGVHKNGTWAAQKIIDVCKSPQQMMLLVEHTRAYTVPLFLDQYGNYVLQGCLKFGAPYNNFIFETMLSKMWGIAKGRYGARAMRACLESHHATKDQQRMLAAAIALNSVQLATNANGALLLTWLLDTCTFPQRRTVLAPRLVPHLVHLCTHKVAYLTVLKVINQKAEPDARDTILKALFFSPNDQVLEAILSDSNCGATLIFKVLTTPFFDENIRAQVVETIKNVLIHIKAQPHQGYKRLMDEVGMPTRPAGATRDASTHSEHRQRPSSRQNGHHIPSGPSNKQYYNQMPSGANTPSYEMGYGQQRPENMDGSMSFPAYGQAMMYAPQGGQVNSAMGMQQMPYQQGMMGRGVPQMGYNFPQMQPGYGPYGSPNPVMDQYRQNAQGGSPIPGQQAQASQMSGGGAYAPPGFNMGMAGGAATGYGYGQMGYAQPQEQSNSRRGRR